MNKDIFKAYDIRGIYPEEINAEDVKKIAMAYAAWLKLADGELAESTKKVALGRDVRLSSPELWQAACDGLVEMGVEVFDIGVISTDMLYFSVANYQLDGGIVITGSHNPVEYNGMKLVREQAKPISIDTGILAIRDIALGEKYEPTGLLGSLKHLDIFEDYIAKMISFVPKEEIKQLKVLVNPNFGVAGVAIDKIADHYHLTLEKLNFEPDGHFPKGQPDPLLVANRKDMENAISASDVDLAVTWDSDADRCMFYDENGAFIPPIYVTGLLMKYFLRDNPGQNIVTDTRLLWLPESLASQYNATVIPNKAGHSFMKERMHQENAIFGAETSAHYYFRDLWFTDNGMLPFIILLKLVSESTDKISRLVEEFRKTFFNIDETNYRVENLQKVLDAVERKYKHGEIDKTDGVSISFSDWRMNLRGAANEPLIRLNIEGKSKKILDLKLAELTEVIGGKKV